MSLPPWPDFDAAKAARAARRAARDGLQYASSLAQRAAPFAEHAAVSAAAYTVALAAVQARQNSVFSPWVGPFRQALRLYIRPRADKTTITCDAGERLRSSVVLCDAGACAWCWLSGRHLGFLRIGSGVCHMGRLPQRRRRCT